jgi:flagellar biosynthetic protein FliO
VESIQQTIVVFFVLALLGGTLYWLRRRGLAQFSFPSKPGSGSRKIQLVERLPLSPQHSLHLVRVGGRELLIGVSPAGCTVLDQAETTGTERAVSR